MFTYRHDHAWICRYVCMYSFVFSTLSTYQDLHPTRFFVLQIGFFWGISTPPRTIFAAKNGTFRAFFRWMDLAGNVPYRGRQHGGCQPRFWSQWPVLDILETHLPWQQRVIQLATVQGHEQETLVEYWGGGGDLGERRRCEKMC